MLMLFTAFSKNRSGDSSAVLVVLIRRVAMLTLRARRAKGFLLLFMAVKEALVFLCLPTAATADMMYWEIGNAKIWKIIKK